MNKQTQLKINELSPSSSDVPSDVKQNEIVYAIMGAYPYSSDWANGLSANHQRKLLGLAHAAMLADGRNVFLKMHGGAEIGDSDSSWYPGRGSRINCLKKHIDGKRILKAEGKSLYMMAEGVTAKELMVSQSLVDLLAKHINTPIYDVNVTKHIHPVGPKLPESLLENQLTYDIESVEASEGYVLERKYLSVERNREIVQKRKTKDNQTCQSCGFRLEIKGRFVIECHHVMQLADTGETITTINDLVSLCPTCHRIAHIRRPLLAVAEVKRIRESM